MPLTSHLEELRYRLIVIVIAYCVGVGISFLFVGRAFEFLKRPLSGIMASHPGSTFAIRSVSEGILVDIKVAMIVGAFVASPVFFYQIWKFISPGLYVHERRLGVPIILTANVLFFTGALFGYLVIFPAAFDFFMSYTSPDTAAILSIDDYLDFSAKLLVGFGLIFEMPLVIFVLAWFGIVDHHQLRKVRRYVIVANFVVAAIITPPDVVSQLGVGIPLVILYEVGIMVAWIIGRKRKSDADIQAEKAALEVAR